MVILVWCLVVMFVVVVPLEQAAFCSPLPLVPALLAPELLPLVAIGLIAAGFVFTDANSMEKICKGVATEVAGVSEWAQAGVGKAWLGMQSVWGGVSSWTQDFVNTLVASGSRSVSYGSDGATFNLDYSSASDWVNGVILSCAGSTNVWLDDFVMEKTYDGGAVSFNHSSGTVIFNFSYTLGSTFYVLGNNTGWGDALAPFTAHVFKDSADWVCEVWNRLGEYKVYRRVGFASSWPVVDSANYSLKFAKTSGVVVVGGTAVIPETDVRSSIDPDWDLSNREVGFPADWVWPNDFLNKDKSSLQVRVPPADAPGSGTDQGSVTGWLSNVWNMVKNVWTAIKGLPASIWAALADLLGIDFGATAVDVGPLRSVGVEVTTKFPFSLPWDLKRLVVVPDEQVPESFSFRFPYVSGEFTVPIPDFLSTVASWVRAGELLLFGVGLVWGTRKMVGGSG